MTSQACASLSMEYEHVANEYQVPKEILYSIALTESVAKTQDGPKPWPYTLNFQQNAYRFDDMASACHALRMILTVSNLVDIGLTQINYHYHPTPEPCDYFNKEFALQKTAEILKECYLVLAWLDEMKNFHFIQPGYFVKHESNDKLK